MAVIGYPKRHLVKLDNKVTFMDQLDTSLEIFSLLCVLFLTNS